MQIVLADVIKLNKGTGVGLHPVGLLSLRRGTFEQRDRHGKGREMMGRHWGTTHVMMEVEIGVVQL